MLLFALWKTNLFFISSLINIYPFPFIVLIKIWHVIESVLLGKALVLVGLLAAFPSVVAFKSLAQKMHSAFVFLFFSLDASALCTDLFAQENFLSLLYNYSLWP